MATRTRTRRPAPTRSTASKSTGAQSVPGANGSAARNGVGARSLTERPPVPSPGRRAWEKRYASTREREGLYPFTISDVPIKALYTPDDVRGIDFERDLGWPGEYPYTRGVHSTMYRGRMFTMRQFAGFGTARESNQRYHYLLAHGQTGLSIAFDNPTIMG